MEYVKKVVILGALLFLFGIYSLYVRKQTAIDMPVKKEDSIVSPSDNFEKSTDIYNDGIYTGEVVDAYYGNVQVEVQIGNGRITAVTFLQYPNDRGRSIEVSNFAMPLLKQETLQKQNEEVDIVSGATETSFAFRESLRSALAKAK